MLIRINQISDYIFYACFNECLKFCFRYDVGFVDVVIFGYNYFVKTKLLYIFVYYSSIFF